MTSPARALAILDLFDADHPVWPTEAIIAQLGYTRATGYRYVKDLVAAGLLRKASAGHYSLGPRIIELDYQLRCSDPVLLAAVPVMDELARRSSLDVVLSMLFGTKLVDTYRASADPTLKLGYGRGRPRPLFQGAAPKVILAGLPRAQLLRLHTAFAVEIAAQRLGDDWPRFRAHMSEIRKAGFYWSQGELEAGVDAAAVPLIRRDRGEAADGGGEVVAALALVGTSQALDLTGAARLQALLADARVRIEARLLDLSVTEGASHLA